MAIVIVERSFDEPVPFERLQAMETAVASCFASHKVVAQHSFRSRDGRHMVCLYDAPDAEAVRATQREANMPFAHIWSATRLTDGACPSLPGFQQVVVQRCFPSRVAETDYRAIRSATRNCMETYRAHLFESYLSLAGDRAICRYVAPDTESVRLANTQSGIPQERAWPAEVIG